MTIRYSNSLEVTSVETFFAGVLNVLRYWRDIHTHGPTWVKTWGGDDDGATVDITEITLENNHYSVNMDKFKLQLAELAMQDQSAYYCVNCGYEGSDSECPECDEGECFSNDAETFVDCMDFTSVDRNHFNQVMSEFAFPIYAKALEPVICDVLEKVDFYIEKLENAESNFDKLCVLIQALSLAHTNGDIFADYLYDGMWNIDEDDVLKIREGGLIAYFDSEDIKEFIES